MATVFGTNIMEKRFRKLIWATVLLVALWIVDNRMDRDTVQQFTQTWRSTLEGNCSGLDKQKLNEGEYTLSKQLKDHFENERLLYLLCVASIIVFVVSRVGEDASQNPKS